MFFFFFFFSSRRRHTRCSRDWSSDVCSSDLAHRRTVSVHDRAQADLLGFAANGGELLLGKRGFAAFTDAAGSKDLNEVGTVPGVLVDDGAKFLGRAGRLAAAENGVERSKNSRAGQSAAVDGVAQVLVERRPQALHRGEARSQHLPTVRGAGEDGLR